MANYVFYFLLIVCFNYTESPIAKKGTHIEDFFKIKYWTKIQLVSIALPSISLKCISHYPTSKHNSFKAKEGINFVNHCSMASENLYSSTTSCMNCLEMTENFKHYKILLGLFFTSTVTLLGVILFYKINILKKSINSFEDDEIYVYPEYTDRPTTLRTPIKLTDSINNNTELTILAELKNFEDNLLFNKKGITLGNLATEFQTNVKYLSAIIKEHKADNFKSYINNLRINYIVDQVKNDPSFKKYKLSYLAELSGFPTASSFTKTFKDIMGTTPSLYFAQMKKKDN